MEDEKKVCTGCGEKNEDSFAMELLKGYKKQFYTTVAVLSVIILFLIGYIVYDKWQDSLYDTVSYTNGDGDYNVIGDNSTGNYGSEAENENTP